jgi:DNA-binding MarR family transcriptional regulator
MTDAVDVVVAQWRTERPDLDPTPMLVVGRISRLAQLLDAELRAPFAEAGLGQGDFDVLAALRRAGAPYTRTPQQLLASLMVTSGAVTKQVDRLAGRGLVTREVNPDDRRGRTIALTSAGLALVDELLATHLANQQRLLSGLSDSEVAQLTAGLARLTAALESPEERAP